MVVLAGIVLLPIIALHVSRKKRFRIEEKTKHCLDSKINLESMPQLFDSELRRHFTIHLRCRGLSFDTLTRRVHTKVKEVGNCLVDWS